MRYSGSKRKFIKELLPILLQNSNEETIFIDAFMGGGNVISEVPLKNKYGFDINRYVIDLWNDIKENGVNSSCITPCLSEDEYYKIKKSYLNKDKQYSNGLIGYVGNCCSYGSAWFNGYAKFNKQKNEDHIKEAYNGMIKHIKGFKFLDNTTFKSWDYRMSTSSIFHKNNTIIYCDPPYASTKKYESDFDNEAFWKWARAFSQKGYRIYISEYDAPCDFKCIWQKMKKDGMGTTKKGFSQNNKIEKLFVYNGKEE